jgi:hypothetical protein
MEPIDPKNVEAQKLISSVVSPVSNLYLLITLDFQVSPG